MGSQALVTLDEITQTPSGSINYCGIACISGKEIVREKLVLVGSLAQFRLRNVQLMRIERLPPSNSGSYSVVARCFDTQSLKIVSVDAKLLKALPCAVASPEVTAAATASWGKFCSEEASAAQHASRRASAAAPTVNAAQRGGPTDAKKVSTKTDLTSDKPLRTERSVAQPEKKKQKLTPQLVKAVKATKAARKVRTPLFIPFSVMSLVLTSPSLHRKTRPRNLHLTATTTTMALRVYLPQP